MVYNYTKPRGPIAAMYSSPGPCYGLPGLVGQSHHDPRSLHNKGPAYPFGVRHGKFQDDCSPGPRYLLNSKVYRNGVDGTPHYSLYGRQKDSTQFKVPGPGAYSPENVGPTAHYRHPAYSFGTRHQNRKTDNTPAANKYSLPSMTGKTVQSGKKQSPIYSMTGRQTQGAFSEDLAKSPGPGTYDNTDPNAYKSKAALYSMTSRNLMPGDNTQKPGPGAHSPENVYINKKQSPVFSFGIRHSQYLAPLIVEVQD
ncbi:outer dense fiber protein 3-like [Ylistrum balloti]|uniref:outer dense fiber protein 3-like n=1 Tax=Ylistrum balloti TaxID=509963 RepID=UPI0029059331|nr:outer dense fiber protein 3-like [Ylistrum balloti]XP_060072853.1 outer dense fiber protein 3-like [Ylistrum balloti]